MKLRFKLCVSEFISVTIKLAEFGGTFHEESPSYPLGALVSDIGGALGLVLGLSILDLLVCSSNFVRKGINGLFAIKRKHDHCRNVSKISILNPNSFCTFRLLKNENSLEP